MTPKNNSRNCVTSYVSCVQWNAGDICCLDVKNGDYLDDITKKIADKLCDLATPLDLSSLTTQCLVDKLNATIPGELTIKNVLQLLIDNECKLADLIAASSSTSNSSLTLDLKCLKKTDSFGNVLPYDTQSVLQILLDEACDNKSKVTSLQTEVATLTDQVNNLAQDPYSLPEVTISECIDPEVSNLPLDEAFEVIAADYCTLKGLIGTEEDLTATIAKECSGLDTKFTGNPSWITNPENITQTLGNLWVAFCDVSNRLKVIEQTCCAPNCDKIKIGFSSTFDTEEQIITLSFLASSGMYLPDGFVDNGTVITITDKNGVSVSVTTGQNSVPLIETNGDPIEISIDGLSSGTLLVSFKTNFILQDEDENTIMTCNNCYAKEIQYVNTSCCAITNIGEETITLTIKTCSS